MSAGLWWPSATSGNRTASGYPRGAMMVAGRWEQVPRTLANPAGYGRYISNNITTRRNNYNRFNLGRARGGGGSARRLTNGPVRRSRRGYGSAAYRPRRAYLKPELKNWDRKTISLAPGAALNLNAVWQVLVMI